MAATSILFDDEFSWQERLGQHGVGTESFGIGEQIEVSRPTAARYCYHLHGWVHFANALDCLVKTSPMQWGSTIKPSDISNVASTARV